jgi:DNA polymerase-3 subunit epsilon
MILAELYRRGEGRRLRAVGQGYDRGLADLARSYGVDVAE